MVKYIKGVLSGKYQENNLFVSLLEALVLKGEREHRGTGIQKFKYPQNLVNFSHIILAIFPAAYRSISEYLPLPQSHTLK
jgi:hypothetical protein